MSTARTFHILLTGGGTGGHLFPAIAAAEEICARRPEAEVLFVGTGRAMDRKALSATGFRVKTILCYGLKGKNPFELAKALIALPLSFLQAAWTIITFKPNVVLGVGGYVTGPVVAAAKILGRRTVIHEQNSVPGLANRKLGKLADTVCISLPQSEQYFPQEKVIHTGNPVRKEIVMLAEQPDVDAADGRVVLLVLGGSLGAHRINELMVEAVTMSSELRKARIIHQTGEADVEMVTARYKDARVDAIVAPFFSDMAAIYAQADLLVSRAGATTLAELAVLGKPAILIPYPYAADDHQAKNGQHYVQGGGCRMFEEKEMTPEKLVAALEEVLTDKRLRQEMKKNMKALALPQAAAHIADVCLHEVQERDDV